MFFRKHVVMIGSTNGREREEVREVFFWENGYEGKCD